MRLGLAITALGLGACAAFDPAPSTDVADAAAPEAGSTPPPAPLSTTGKLVFITAQKENASELKTAALCTNALVAHGRGGGFAWAQGADGTGPLAKLGTYAGPWVTPSGKTVFAARADITGGQGAASPIDETLDRTFVAGGDVWTGLDATGAPIAGGNCGGWATPLSSASGAAVGTLGTTWADTGAKLDCHGQNYVICFEQ